MKKNGIFLFATILSIASLTSCSGGGVYQNYSPDRYSDETGKDGRYEEHEELGFVNMSDTTEMYLSLDNSSYSYTDVRNYINSGHEVPTSAVNIEEMLNYFQYDYEAESGVNITAEVSNCPWNSENLLETIAIYAPITGERLPSNITFLVDVSGSMSDDSRLGLFQNAFEVAMPYLQSYDKISLVTYASGVKTILDGISGENKTVLHDKVMNLSASGSTNGAGGIKQAYNVAKKNFIEGGINHIFIVTDGDFNVGISSEEELGKMVKANANEGIYLSIFGVGMYNTRQSMIETIKKNGEGNCYYLDSVAEGAKALEVALKGGMRVLTKDTKAKISFDPRYVSKFRVLGYENKLLTSEEYEDEDTNAGEIFEGYQVMIAFELVPTEETGEEISTIEIKYKDFQTLEDKVINATSKTSNSNNHQFASMVCEFGLILRKSAYKKDASINNIISRVEDLTSYINEDDSKKEFIELVNKYKKVNNDSHSGHYYNE